jgi:hypothetical protein
MATPPAVLAVMRAARIICRTPRDAVMFAVHCTFMAEGYVLLAAGDNVDPMMFQTKEEEPDDGLPKRRPDPHLGWNDMEDEYAFKYCALGDYDNLGGKPRRGRYSGAILKAMHVGNTLMVHAVRTEDGVRSETLASAEFPLATHAKDADEVTLAADPSLALANVADLVAATRSSLIDPITPPNKEDEAKGDDEGERAKTGTSSAAAGGEGEKASGGGEAGRGGEGGGDLNMDGNPFRCPACVPWVLRCRSSAGSSRVTHGSRPAAVRPRSSILTWTSAAFPTGFIPSRVPAGWVSGVRGVRRGGRVPVELRGGTPTSVRRPRAENARGEWRGSEERRVKISFGVYMRIDSIPSVVAAFLPDLGVPRGHLDV